MCYSSFHELMITSLVVAISFIFKHQYLWDIIHEIRKYKSVLQSIQCFLNLKHAALSLGYRSRIFMWICKELWSLSFRNFPSILHCR